ncbi:PepSY domain-containing protein [Marinobacter sp. VGCF2001]|uniref:PepSY domain-containing protein n=1 Tax=Marinobacter sp. VGCF2001 TaxID=3417189 RepID=UPI003CEA30DA
MLRKLHGLPGLIAALFLVMLAVTGAILAIAPALDRAGVSPLSAGEISVAELAGRVVDNYPGTEQIVRDLSGQVVVYYSRNGQPGADRIDPTTGESLGAYQPSAFFVWIKNLHRSFLLDTPGRVLAGVSAVVMLLICVSGLVLLVRRCGGWRALMRPLAGSGSARLHAELARLATLGLLLSALTGSYLSAQRFGLVPEVSSLGPDFPAEVSGGQPQPVDQLQALSGVDLNDLRELVFPYPGDPRDVYSLTTTAGAGFVDQSTGELLQFRRRSVGSQAQHWIMRLHTAEGLWWWGLILGISALAVPVLSVTGAVIWWRRRSPTTAIDNASAAEADVIVLVGSEGGSTRGFARVLQMQLSGAGFRVHCAEMNALAPSYPQASKLLIMTSTYGDGDAPASGRQFMARLGDFKAGKALKYAVLGFGDRQFPRFCQFALDVDEALSDKGLSRLQPVELIDRCSPARFSQWGDQLGAALGTSLSLSHEPSPPAAFPLELVDRVDYGQAVNAPTSILRFRPVDEGRSSLFRWGRKRIPDFEAGDLLGILPPEDQKARFYSLASSARDGVFEICVRKQPGGLCSGYLHDLTPGDCVTAFIRHNSGFRPASGTVPVILIGAGAGIGPLAGFIRNNSARHPMYLYWGGRNPNSDFLYQPELGHYLADHRLTGLSTAFSRSDEKAYVQDKLRQDQTALRQMVDTGAQILVCGGRDMAAGVKQVFEEILRPLSLGVEDLREQGRYLEDVY